MNKYLLRDLKQYGLKSASDFKLTQQNIGLPEWANEEALAEAVETKNALMPMLAEIATEEEIAFLNELTHFMLWRERSAKKAVQTEYKRTEYLRAFLNKAKERNTELLIKYPKQEIKVQEVDMDAPSEFEFKFFGRPRPNGVICPVSEEIRCTLRQAIEKAKKMSRYYKSPVGVYNEIGEEVYSYTEK